MPRSSFCGKFYRKHIAQVAIMSFNRIHEFTSFGNLCEILPVIQEDKTYHWVSLSISVTSLKDSKFLGFEIDYIQLRIV